MEMKKIYPNDRLMITKTNAYCPGCSHGLVQKLLVETIEELGIAEDSIGVSPIGCGGNIHRYIGIDFVQAAHGRAPAVATGIKRALPDKIVFTYQGDGDLISIGASNIIHAAARNEKITVFFVNNGVFGNTGGQMAPTTLIGQKTTTSPTGRDSNLTGFPIRVCEMLATFPGNSYIARTALNSPKSVKIAKRYIKKAFLNQMKGIGFSLVEFLSICPTHWKLSPLEAIDRVSNLLTEYYKLGEFLTSEELEEK